MFVKINIYRVTFGEIVSAVFCENEIGSHSHAQEEWDGWEGVHLTSGRRSDRVTASVRITQRDD